MKVAYKINIFQMNPLDNICIYKAIKTPLQNLKTFIKKSDAELNFHFPKLCLN